MVVNGSVSSPSEERRRRASVLVNGSGRLKGKFISNFYREWEGWG